MTPLELKIYRKTLGISQTEAASRLGINFRTYWRYENEPDQGGASRIKPEQIKALKGGVCPACGQTLVDQLAPTEVG